MEGAIPAWMEGGITRISHVTPADNPTMMSILGHIEHILEELSRADVYQTPTMTVTGLVSGVQRVGLQVYVMNTDLLGNIEAARWAVADLAYVRMLDLLAIQRGIGWRAGQLHQDILQLNVALDSGMAGLAFELTAFADCACTALQAILDQLRAGLRVTGAVTLVVDFSGALAGLDIGKLLKLLGIATGFVVLLGAALAGLVIFVYLLAQALKTFDLSAIAAILALAGLFDSLVNLATVLADFSVGQLIQLGLAFLGIAGFIYVLGKTLGTISAQAVAAIPALAGLFDSLVNLATVLADFSVGQLIQLGLAFLGIAGFIYVLGKTLDSLSAQAVAAIPVLTQLFESLIELATFINNLSGGQLIVIGVAMAVLTAFMYGMAAALDKATPGLAELAAVLSSVQAILSSIISVAQGAASALSGVLRFSGGGGLGSLFSFQEGGVMPRTGLAVLHEGERVLTPAESQALEGASAAALVPGGPLPAGLPAAAAGPTTVDQSVNVQGGITVNISAERLEADSARLLTDEIVQRLQERLGALRSEQDFRNGVRAPTPA